jgi:hypothetical protein
MVELNLDHWKNYDKSPIDFIYDPTSFNIFKWRDTTYTVK